MTSHLRIPEGRLTATPRTPAPTKDGAAGRRQPGVPAGATSAVA